MEIYKYNEHSYIEQLKKENEKLRKTLSFYADEKNYKNSAFWKIVIDEGERARRVLEETQSMEGMNGKSFTKTLGE